jgi:predicted ABC-type ATPase
LTRPDVGGPPKLLIIAGPNGSGKTTLTNRLRAMGLDFGEYINADEIALELTQDAERDRAAQMEADRRRAAALREKRSFSFETVMSHPSKIEEMRAAKAAGYHVTFIGVSLQNPELNVARVALRVSEGGHDVPTDRIIARYERTLSLMPDAIMVADRTLVFDNSDSVLGPLVVLTAQNLVFRLGRSVLVVRISASVKQHPGHWAARYLVEGLKNHEMNNVGRLRFGLDLED